MTENNKLIAEFMGFIHETEVTIYEYGMDFRSTYGQETIYSNILPILTTFEEKFGNQILDTYSNYFELDNQHSDFNCQSYFTYDTSWNSLMAVIDKIESLEVEYKEVKHTFDVHISKDEVEITISSERDKPIMLQGLVGHNGIVEFMTFDKGEKLQVCYEMIVFFINWYNKIDSV